MSLGNNVTRFECNASKYESSKMLIRAHSLASLSASKAISVMRIPLPARSCISSLIKRKNGALGINKLVDVCNLLISRRTRVPERGLRFEVADVLGSVGFCWSEDESFVRRDAATLVRGWEVPSVLFVGNDFRLTIWFSCCFERCSK
jgi:hypothetical protein